MAEPIILQVTSALLISGEHFDVGEILDGMPNELVAELLASGRVRRVTAAEAAEAAKPAKPAKG